MTYTWNGNGFNEVVFLTSQYLIDPNNNIYYYDQNYVGFFPVLFTNGVIIYNDSSFLPVTIASGTVFIDDPTLSAIPNINCISAIIFSGRFALFQSNLSNILEIYTQNPSAFVANAINGIDDSTTVSKSLPLPVFQSLSTNTPFLVSTALNFGFKDILSSWPNGNSVIQSLASTLSNHQANLNGTNDKIHSIIDFKKKLVKQQVALADKTRMLQGQVDQWANGGTFSTLASKFTEFTQLKSTLDDSNSYLSNELTKLLPSSSIASTVLSGVFNKVFGSSGLPVIVNPVDKILSDITNLTSAGTAILNNTFNVTAFGDVASESSFVNQALTILNNLMSQIPITPTINIPGSTTNPLQIFSSLNAYAVAQTGTQVTNALQQQAFTALTNLMTMAASGLPSAIAQSSSDSFLGGSFLNLPSFSGLLSEIDPSITGPNITGSPDPTIAQSQITAQKTQNQINQPGVYQNTVRGTSINNITDVPLRPRNVVVADNSSGDYQIDPNIPV
jgi:hypothetical protein